MSCMTGYNFAVWIIVTIAIPIRVSITAYQHGAKDAGSEGDYN